MKNIYVFLCSLFLSLISGDECPNECTCEKAPLRSAPFILKWMTSWGDDNLPDIHANDVIDASQLVSSKTAKDAGVDVDEVGVHATCSIYPATNTTVLLSSLPQQTMVLTLLQSPGCNLTFLEGGDFANLNYLVGLHVQGYAHHAKQQVSGLTYNRVSDMITHQKLLEAEMMEDHEEKKYLKLALAEDALQPLTGLKLLDLQYVRLVLSKEIRRLRRFSKDPLSSSTIVDLPFSRFMEVASRVDSFRLPPYINEYEFPTYDDISVEENIFPIEEENVPTLFSGLDSLLGSRKKSNPMSIKKNKLIPYMVFKSNFEHVMAPFKQLRKLKYLRVAHAKLDKIGKELLDGLHSLHTLTLDHNFIQVIPEDIFNPCPLLKHLSLAYNKIFNLESKSFKGLTQLETIDVAHNKIQVIGSATFAPLPYLKSIYANDNPISHILPDAFTYVNRTESIVLGSLNTSMDIHENSFKNLPFLTKLVLENVTKSNLKKRLFTGLKELQYLTMHGHILEIDFDAFSEITFLKELDLSNSHLKYISMDAFFGLHNLAKLVLSHNHIISFAPGTFDHLVNLRELYLNNNDLTTLTLGIFLPIPAKLIRMENNPWDCTCNLLQLRPTITNKINRPGSVECNWDDKFGTACKKEKDKLVYDARVAPLCVSPPNLQGYDVYHAALRHLKCNKYHWDPKLLYVEKELSESAKSISPKTFQIKEVSTTESGWIPLVDHTPSPINSKDLLSIAEEDGLEEVIEITTPKENSLQNMSKKNSLSSNKISDVLKDQAEPFSNKLYLFSKKTIQKRNKLKMAAFQEAINRKSTLKKQFKNHYKRKMKRQELHKLKLARKNLMKKKMEKERLYKKLGKVKIKALIQRKQLEILEKENEV